VDTIFIFVAYLNLETMQHFCDSTKIQVTPTTISVTSQKFTRTHEVLSYDPCYRFWLTKDSASFFIRPNGICNYGKATENFDMHSDYTPCKENY
jgi:hypothetical protein